MKKDKPPQIIYFWPDSGDEDANCGLWWPEPTLDDAPEAGPGRPALVVPDMTEEAARAALMGAHPSDDTLLIALGMMLERSIDAVAVLLAAAYKRREKRGTDG